MLVNGVWVTFYNLYEWSVSRLRDIKATLSDNIEKSRGDKEFQACLIKLIDIEIDRKIRTENIDLSAERKSRSIIKKAGLEHIDP